MAFAVNLKDEEDGHAMQQREYVLCNANVPAVMCEKVEQ